MLLRTREAGRGPVRVGVRLAWPARSLQPERVVQIVLQATALQAGIGAARGWLIGDDGVLVAWPAGVPLDAASDGSWWRRFRHGGELSGMITAAMPDGVHAMSYRRVADWPLTVVVDAGLAQRPGLSGAEVAAICLVLVALLLLVMSQTEPGTGRGVFKTGLPAGNAGPPLSEAEMVLRQFAAGVAHDVNNVLTVLAIEAEMMARRGSNAAAPAVHRAMLAAIDRGVALTETMLAFAERRPIEPGRTELRAWFAGTADLWTAGARAGQRMRLKGLDGPPIVVTEGRPGLQACLLGLIGRAAAMDGATHPGREIALELSVLGGEAVISVTPADNTNRAVVAQGSDALDPGYVAEAGSVQLGLALAAAQGFARQAGGRLVVGAFGRVSVHLPFERAAAVPTAFGAVSRFRPAEGPTGRAAGRGHRVLLVDDDAAVRDALAGWLRAEGHEVLTAGDTIEAEVFLAEPVDLLVTDVVFADAAGDGFALAARARSVDRLLPLVFISGFMTKRQPSLLADDELVSFLRKPVAAAELRMVVRGLLALRESRDLPIV